MPSGICIWDSLGRMYNGAPGSGELGLSAAEALGWGTGSKAGARCRASYLCLQLGPGDGGRQEERRAPAICPTGWLLLVSSVIGPHYYI